MSSLNERILNIARTIFAVAKTELVFLSLSIVFLMLSFAAFALSMKQGSSKSPITIERGATEGEKITVDVAGAVERPGVYELKDGARVKDALIAANGISGRADRRFVAESINGARIITDGEKIFIPEPLPTSFVLSVHDSVNSRQGNININTASDSELDSLPGIGEKTVKKIVAGRPYSAILELRERKIVGQAVFDKIKSLIATY